MWYALDGAYRPALEAVAKAESFGAQNPSWNAAARRLLILGKSGDYEASGRLADSLTSASFFQNPNNGLVHGDAAAWAFALHVLRGQPAMASTLLEQNAALVRLVNPQNPSPMFSALRNLMGNEDPDAEPGIPRAFRSRQLDTVLAHLEEFAASERIGPWTPLLLPLLVEAADPGAMRSGDVLQAVDRLAGAGREAFAFETASNIVLSDSSAAVPAAAYGWYRRGADALNATRAARAARFRPATAIISADRATFEWAVSDSAPFTWHLRETPVAQGEYRWEVRLEAQARLYRLVVAADRKEAGAAPASGSLAQLLPPQATRTVTSGTIGANGVPTDTTLLQGVTLRTEIAPGVLRLIVTDRAVVDDLRRRRPSEATFRFSPCIAPVGVIRRRECAGESVAISYR